MTTPRSIITTPRSNSSRSVSPRPYTITVNPSKVNVSMSSSPIVTATATTTTTRAFSPVPSNRKPLVISQSPSCNASPVLTADEERLARMRRMLHNFKQQLLVLERDEVGEGSDRDLSDSADDSEDFEDNNDLYAYDSFLSNDKNNDVTKGRKFNKECLKKTNNKISSITPPAKYKEQRSDDNLSSSDVEDADFVAENLSDFRGFGKKTKEKEKFGDGGGNVKKKGCAMQQVVEKGKKSQGGGSKGNNMEKNSSFNKK
uniref:Uncharacterized protein n=1 Tax=Polytomella parva TaxID=51329 RepID=A0A7S0YPM4_9CHLO|mmetsp:Transcript_6936/g.13662  ORF Transcript_6936/g.13662 Transcript_6936/m.13662 type:complete len:258 (+) Transcript_6936:2-775(+)